MKIELNDRITFKAATRSGYKKVTRKVIGFSMNKFPEVRYEGWSNFVVYPEEIKEVNGETYDSNLR